ncbi:unnamed protein product [Cylindrotheca closterium]|uniref:Uncharacterized protein n=1 Tax=Cylindrotheca closterium TaxID=2856 RepID=A0AAD2G2S9_9STRA|nr:unnamed protein product [Cylindrotheca closterium]
MFRLARPEKEGKNRCSIQLLSKNLVTRPKGDPLRMMISVCPKSTSTERLVAQLVATVDKSTKRAQTPFPRVTISERLPQHERHKEDPDASIPTCGQHSCCSALF